MIFFLKFGSIESMDVFQDWLNQLAQELKLNEALVLDEKNRCFLMFDDTMLVEIEYKKEEAVFYMKGNLGDVSESKIKLIYPKLLESNLAWKETNGATLGLQQYSEKVLLVQSVPIATCDYALFAKSLEVFVNTFEFWIKNLQELQMTPIKSKDNVSGVRV